MSRGMLISVTSDWSALMLASMIESLFTPLLLARRPSLLSRPSSRTVSRLLSSSWFSDAVALGSTVALDDGVGDAWPTSSDGCSRTSPTMAAITPRVITPPMIHLLGPDLGPDDAAGPSGVAWGLVMRAASLRRACQRLLGRHPAVDQLVVVAGRLLVARARARDRRHRRLAA